MLNSEPILQVPGYFVCRGTEVEWPLNLRPGSVLVISGHPTDVVMLDRREWYEPIEDEL